MARFKHFILHMGLTSILMLGMYCLSGNLTRNTHTSIFSCEAVNHLWVTVAHIFPNHRLVEGGWAPAHDFFFRIFMA